MTIVAEMLVIPHGRDQGDNAARVSERDAELARDAETREIRSAMARLLSEESLRAAARELGDAVTAEAAAGTLVTDLEGLAHAGLWVRRQEWGSST